MAQPWEQLADLVACVYDRCALLEQPPETRLDGLSTLQKREQQWHNQALEIMDGGGVCGFTYLSHMLNLTTFETHCFRMTLAVELDSNLEGVYAKAQDGVCRLPTVTLCLDTFATAPQSRTKALTNWRSHRETLKLLFDQGLTVDSPQSALTVGLKLSPRIVDFILDPGTPNTALVGKINLDLTPTTMVIHQDLVENLHLFQQENPSLYHIHGDKGVGKQTLVRHSLSTQKKAPLVVEIPALLGIDEWNRAILQVCREVVLTGGVPVLSGCDVLAPMENQPPDGRLSAMLQQLSKCSDTVFFLSQCKWEQSWDATPFARVSLEIPIPDTQERMALFAHGFRNLPLAEDVQFEAVATKFTLTPAQIDGAVQEAKRHQGALTSQDIHGFCRNQLAHGMGKMATSIPAVYRWEDLILPPKQKKKLEYACAQVEYRHRVYHSWGFGSKRAYGRGLSVLFSGPPGTGKTMAAQVMANRLHLDLYKVDIAGVMSKYIGETEKQLGAVFDEAKKSQSILFFDEADAIFGKRSETKDSHDRYANVQTAYLLQKMEEYDGIVLLASNYLENFDEAFKRRITYIIDFTLPDELHRGQIWRSVLPSTAPLAEDVDVDFLARSFQLSGSSIKNIALSAAFLAVQEDASISMTHLLLAIKAEEEKAGKLLRREEFGEYYLQIAPYL